VCHYLDMPLQHASDAMLLAMKRGITQRKTMDLISKFRRIVPDLAMRTTFIVGFPGETDKDFEQLINFMREIRFERLGIFTYSQESGTPAAAMPNQVPEDVKQGRLEQAMLVQQEISSENNRRYLGQTLKVLIDEKVDHQDHQWIGRTFMDAPEVDGNVYVNSEKTLEVGRFYRVRIKSTQEYDLVGEA